MATPPPVPGAEQLTINLDATFVDKGKHKVDIETISVSAGTSVQDITFVDASSITEIEIKGFNGAGKNPDDGVQDVFRFDLANFNDDFTITVKDETSLDIFYIEGFDSVVDTGGGSFTYTYTGSDGLSHEAILQAGVAQVQSFTTDGIVEGLETGELMNPGYTDADGDIIDGADGNDDIIRGNGGNDTINAGSGNDSVEGGAGADSMDGGVGTDDLTYENSGAGVTVTLGSGTGSGGDAQGDTNTGFENLTGSAFNDSLTGDAGSNIIAGGAGDDAIFASTGSDTIIGGAGSDTYDTSSLSGGGVVVDGSGATTTIPGPGPDEYTYAILSDGQIEVDVEIDTNPTEDREDITFTDGGNLTSIEIAKIGKDDGAEDLFRFDLSGFNDDFSISLLSEGPEDKIIFENVTSWSEAGGIYTVEYVGSDDLTHTTTVTPGDATIIISTVFPPETITVNVDNNGSGTVAKSLDGTTDTVTSVETYIANEAAAEADSITITDSGTGFTTADIVDVDTGAQDGTTSGTFTPVATGTPIAFGPAEALSYDAIIAGINDGTYPGGGAFQITGGDESGTVGGISFANFEQINFGVVCFARGTLIKTIKGEVRIEDLSPGDRVLTLDCGFQPISWVGGRSLGQAELQQNPKLRPIRIRAAALGPDLPEQDLIVSPQHRVLIRSAIAVKMFDTAEVLVPANKLLILEGIDIEWDALSVDYFHMLFDQHQIVFSNGSPTESLFTGPEALKAVSEEARAEIEALFPNICCPDFVPVPARLIPKNGKQMKALAQRLAKNNKPAQDISLGD